MLLLNTVRRKENYEIKSYVSSNFEGSYMEIFTKVVEFKRVGEVTFLVTGIDRNHTPNIARKFHRRFQVKM